MLSRGAEQARRIAVVEPHVLQRHRAAELLGTLPPVRSVDAFASMAELVARMRGSERSTWPHLLVVDPATGSGAEHDLSAIAAFRAAGMRVVVLSALDSRHLIRRITRAGVDGIVTKQDPESELLRTIVRVLAGSAAVTARAQAVIDADPAPKLSGQEARLLELYAAGRPLASVADRLGVREDTARKYLKRIKLKYDAQGRPARSKLELAWRAREDGFLDPAAFGSVAF